MECRFNELESIAYKRRLVLLLDGTWNDPEITDTDTNIVRLRDLLARLLSDDWMPRTISDAIKYDRSSTLINGRRFGNFEYFLFYERGVGTGPIFDQLGGGAFGWGLGRNVRRAYKFISRYYRNGDEIFIFGFSRGAFTARSLVGYIGASGLLNECYCDVENERKAWSYYRTSPNDRAPKEKLQLDEITHPERTVRIACLGIFDTVGALGIPATLMLRLNRVFYQFHDVELSPIVRLNLHALAIDERRRPFAASVFRRSRFRQSNSVTEQAWFPGVHADVGGGYIDDFDRKRGIQSLDEVTLDWMIKRVAFYYRDFPPLQDAFPPFLGPREPLSVQHESRKRFYRLYRSGVRAIGNRKPKLSWWESPVSLNRNEWVIGETVHISAIERLGLEAPYKSSNKLRHYLPKNLLEVMSELHEKYCAQTDKDWPSDSLSVTAWDGQVVFDSRTAIRLDCDGNAPNLQYVAAEISGAISRLEKLGVMILT